MIENVLFEFVRGNTFEKDFTITGWSFPITKAYFTVKGTLKDKNAVLQKTLNDGITLVSDEEGVKTYNLSICCTDTENMKTDYDYTFDVEIHSPGVGDDVIKKTIMTGTLRLKAESTRACNEC